MTIQTDLKTTPSLIYGLKEDALFEPIRDVAFATIQKGVGVIHWALLTSEALIAAFRRVPPPSSMLRRRSEAYKVLNKAVSDPCQRTSDYLLSGIVMAIIFESRNNPDPGVIQMHIDGYEALIQSRGGYEGIFSRPVSSIFMLRTLPYLLPYIHYENLVKDSKRLQSLARQVGTQLLKMWDWQRSLRKESTSEEVTNLINTYADVFSTPLLAPFISPKSPLGCTTYPQRSSHFVVLYNLNYSLWLLRDDLPTATRHLRSLLHTIEESVARDQKGSSLLKIEGLLWIVADTGRGMELQEHISNATRGMKLARTVNDHVNAVKFFGTANDETRTKILEMLASGLTDRARPSGGLA